MLGRTFERERNCSCTWNTSRPRTVQSFSVLGETLLRPRRLYSGILVGCCRSSGAPGRVGKSSLGSASLSSHGFEVSDVRDCSLPLAGLFPDCLDLHSDPYLRRFYFSQVVEYSHAGAGAVYVDDCDQNWGLEASRVSPYVGDGEGVDCPSVLDLDPLVCWSVALLAVHSWRDKYSLASVALSSNDSAVFQLVQESADGDSSSPAVSGDELVVDIEVFSFLQLIRRDLVARITRYFLGHFLFSPLGPHHCDRPDLH